MCRGSGVLDAQSLFIGRESKDSGVLSLVGSIGELDACLATVSFGEHQAGEHREDALQVIRRATTLLVQVCDLTAGEVERPPVGGLVEVALTARLSASQSS